MQLSRKWLSGPGNTVDTMHRLLEKILLQNINSFSINIFSITQKTFDRMASGLLYGHSRMKHSKMVQQSSE